MWERGLKNGQILFFLFFLESKFISLQGSYGEGGRGGTVLLGIRNLNIYKRRKIKSESLRISSLP